MVMMTKTDQVTVLRGLYVITREAPAPLPSVDPQWQARQVAQAIQGGARIIQYRDKSARHENRLDEATALLQVCRAHGVPLIINDDVELAQQTGADGVHLGGEDVACHAAREQLGPGVIIGISCYNQLDLAVRAEAQGANYVAFGRFFASRNKPQAMQADVELLRQARRKITIPIVAIGGITPENGHSLINAGADMLAVIDAVFGPDASGHVDSEAAARQFDQCFPEH